MEREQELKRIWDTDSIKAKDAIILTDRMDEIFDYIDELKREIHSNSEHYKVVSSINEDLQNENIAFKAELKACKGDVVAENVGTFCETYDYLTDYMMEKLSYSHPVNDKFHVIIKQVKQ